MSCACMGPQNGEPLCPCRMREARAHDVRYPFTPDWMLWRGKGTPPIDRYPFTPDWILSPTETMAVKLSIALSRHVPNWPGATDEQLAAVAAEILETQS